MDLQIQCNAPIFDQSKTAPVFGTKFGFGRRRGQGALVDVGVGTAPTALPGRVAQRGLPGGDDFVEGGTGSTTRRPGAPHDGVERIAWSGVHSNRAQGDGVAGAGGARAAR